MNKKLFAMLLMLALCVLGLTLTASAAEVTSGTCGAVGNENNVTWSYDAGKLTISGTGAMANYSDPKNVPWLSYIGSITTAEIRDGVTTIGLYAFNGPALTSVTIPSSVTTVSNYAFYNATQLTTVTFNGNSLKTIGGGAFLNTGLSTIKLPNSVTTIGAQAFWGCRDLVSINIPSGVTSIGYHVFDGCKSLTTITIPDSVTTIDEGAFNDCKALKSITIPNSVTTIGEGAFKNCEALESVTIPGSVTIIAMEAFYGCKALESVTIPNSVTTIAAYAFHGCTSLESLSIPNNVTSIGDRAFYECENLKSINIPSGVTSIGNQVFNSCSSLTEIVIPASVKSIGNNAFSNCSNLTKVNIPSYVTSIGSHAFFNTGLTTITIPGSVTEIGDNAFQNCTNLTTIIYQGTTPPENVADDAIPANATVEVPVGYAGTSFGNITVDNLVGYCTVPGCTSAVRLAACKAHYICEEHSVADIQNHEQETNCEHYKCQNHKTITVTATNGSVTAAPTCALAGETVTLTITPAEGYVLDTLSVMNGEESIQYSGTYTFTMPAANVTVLATLEPIPATLPVIQSTSLSPDGVIEYGSGTTPTLTVVASPAEGHTLSYQWYSATSSITNGIEILGATGNSYVIGSDCNAGEYYYYCVVTAKRTDNQQTASVTTDVVQLTVNKKTISAPTIVSKDYNGANQTADVSDTAEYTVTTNAGGTNAGKYTVELKLKDSVNYTWSGTTKDTKSFDFEITRKKITVSGITAEDKVYDGTAAATLNYGSAELKGKVENDDLTVTATGTFDNANAGTDKTVVISNLTLGGNDAGNYILATSGQQTSTTANINKAAQAAPATPELESSTSTMIKVKEIAADPVKVDVKTQYACIKSNATPAENDWQPSNVFENLEKNTTYYVFARYNKGTNYTASPASAALQVETHNVCSIVFKTQGGSAVATITQDCCSPVIAPAAPTKAGHTFMGWNPALPSVMPEAEKTTLTAIWNCTDSRDLDNHKCDIAGCSLRVANVCWDDNDGDHACNECGNVLQYGCVDDDRDHYCDFCPIQLTTCNDARDDIDHLCDLCGAQVANPEPCWDNTSLELDVDGHTCNAIGCGKQIDPSVKDFCWDFDKDGKCEECGWVIGSPVVQPTAAPTVEPTAAPTVEPTVEPTVAPTATPTVAPKYGVAVDGKNGTITRTNDTSVYYKDTYIRYSIGYEMGGTSYAVIAMLKVDWTETQEGVVGTFTIPRIQGSGTVTGASYIVTTNADADGLSIAGAAKDAYGMLIQ